MYKIVHTALNKYFAICILANLKHHQHSFVLFFGDNNVI
jgi:hypothetical protein